MKSLFILIVFFSFSLGAFAQADSNGFTNKEEAKNQIVNGVKEGKWILYLDSDENTTSDTSAPYYALVLARHGVAYGITRRYYKSGKLMSEGGVSGIEKWYYEDGKLQAEVPYVNNRKNGMEKWYYESGKLKWEAPDLNDSINGVQKNYYENGTLKGEYPYTRGKENGTEKEYYENGKLKTETPYNNGVAGESDTYDEHWGETK